MADKTKSTEPTEPTGPTTGQRIGAAAASTGLWIADYFAAKRNHKYQKRMQAHRDKVRRMGQAINDSAITRNAIWAEQDLRLSRLSSDMESTTAAGTNAVQTAVMGFSGSTADAVANAYQQSEDLKRRSIDRQQKKLQQAEAYQRLRNDWNTYTQMESIHAPVPRPDYAMMMVKGAVDIGKSASSGGMG